MKRTSILLLSLTLILAVGATAHADQIDDWVKAQMQIRHVPALSIAVVKDGVLVKAEGYGVADLEHNISARPDTVYKIGSVSKQFIAAGVMLLVQDGRITLGETVGRYIGGTPSAWQGSRYVIY
jgi:CubicO group peptidase (beta-lactamase class C family)